jgi:hypothetical protein
MLYNQKYLLQGCELIQLAQTLLISIRPLSFTTEPPSGNAKAAWGRCSFMEKQMALSHITL